VHLYPNRASERSERATIHETRPVRPSRCHNKFQPRLPSQTSYVFVISEQLQSGTTFLLLDKYVVHLYRIVQYKIALLLMYSVSDLNFAY